MKKVSYVIYIHNDADNIVELFKSLNSLRGNSTHEFIIIDDGSIDRSLELIKANIKNLLRVTIISQQQHGPAAGLNKALKLIHGDYVRFIKGRTTVLPDSTEALLAACKQTSKEVAIGLCQNPSDAYKATGAISVIQNPISAILKNSPTQSRFLFSSSSLISSRLLEKIGAINEGVYLPDVILSLEAAKRTDFALLDEFVSASDNSKGVYENYLTYNNIQSLYSFATNNQELMENYRPQLLLALKLELKGKGLNQLKFFLEYLLCKYLNFYSLNKILDSYKMILRKEL